MEQLNWQINSLQANQLAKTALQLQARAQTILRKNTRSSQLHKKWPMEKVLRLFVSKSIWLWGINSIFILAIAWRVSCRTIKYLIQLVNLQLQAQPISILECMDKVHKQNKTCPMFQQASLTRLMPMLWRLRITQFLLSGKIQMQFSMVWQPWNICSRKVKFQFFAMWRWKITQSSRTVVSSKVTMETHGLMQIVQNSCALVVIWNWTNTSLHQKMIHTTTRNGVNSIQKKN